MSDTTRTPQPPLHPELAPGESEEVSKQEAILRVEQDSRAAKVKAEAKASHEKPDDPGKNANPDG